MDSRGNIYSAPEGLIPLDDKARLDGYLRGREEADLLKDGKTADLAAKVRELEATREAAAVGSVRGPERDPDTEESR